MSDLSRSTLHNLVRIAFGAPGMDFDECERLLWGVTGWPGFLVPTPHKDVVRVLYEQLQHAARSMRRGFSAGQVWIGDDTLNPKHKPFGWEDEQ